MKRRSAAVVAVIASLLACGYAWAADATPTPHAAPVVAADQIGIGAGVTTTVPHEPPPVASGPHRISFPYHWSTVALAGYCNVAGESGQWPWTDSGGTLPSFVNGGGSQTMYTSILIYDDSGLVVPGSMIRKRCGNAPAPIPAPPTTPQIEQWFEGQQQLQASIAASPLGTPAHPGLVRMETDLSASASPQTISHTFAGGWVVTLTAVPVGYSWDFGEPWCPNAAGGRVTSYAWCSSGPHTVDLAVSWDATVSLSGPVTLANATTGRLVSHSTQPYYLIEARGVLVP